VRGKILKSALRRHYGGSASVTHGHIGEGEST
jgi:hypothetical protein